MRWSDLPGARVLGTVVVHELLFAIRTPEAHSWVEKLTPDSSILTNLRVFLSTCRRNQSTKFLVARGPADSKEVSTLEQFPPQLATYVKTGPMLCGQVVHWNSTVLPAATVAVTLALIAFLWQTILGSLHPALAYAPSFRP